MTSLFLDGWHSKNRSTAPCFAMNRFLIGSSASGHVLAAFETCKAEKRHVVASVAGLVVVENMSYLDADGRTKDLGKMKD